MFTRLACMYPAEIGWKCKCLILPCLSQHLPLITFGIYFSGRHSVLVHTCHCAADYTIIAGTEVPWHISLAIVKPRDFSILQCMASAKGKWGQNKQGLADVQLGAIPVSITYQTARNWEGRACKVSAVFGFES